MGKVLNFITVLFVILFSVKTFALESSDTLDSQILKIYSKNILVLNRGLEDAIYKKDHAKLTSDDGFIARGICIKTSMLTSHWKIYRVVRPGLVNKDTLYRVKSINQSKIPRDLVKFSKVDFTKHWDDFGDKNVEEQQKLQEDRVAKYDLPENVRSTRAFKKDNMTGLQKLITTNFNRNQFTDDISQTYLEVYTDPLTWETRDEKAQFIFGGALYNKGEKYQFSAHMDEEQLKYPGYLERETHYDFQFDIYRFTENISIITNFEYDKSNVDGRFFPLRRQQYGVFGFRYHIWNEKNKNNYFDISYLPTYDYFEYANPSTTELEIREGVRHVFSMRLGFQFTDDLLWKNKLTWRPMSGFSKEVSDADTNPHFNTNLAYRVKENLFFEYDVTYEKDGLLGEVYDVRSENLKSNIQLRYSFQL